MEEMFEVLMFASACLCEPQSDSLFGILLAKLIDLEMLEFKQE
jgi:hypothetical protein